METATLLMAILTLLTVGTFFFIYFKNVKAQRLTDQQGLDSILSKLEEAKNILEKGISEVGQQTNTKLNSLSKEFAELKQAVLSDNKELATNYENQNKQVIEKFSANLNELIKGNKEFKQQLSESHQQTLKSIQTELNKILTEIKSPLEDEPN